MNNSPQSVVLDKDHQQFLEEMKTGQNNIMVVVRTRPLNQRELTKSDYETLKILDNRVVVLLDPGYEMNQDDVLRKNRNKEMQFAFDFAFDKETDQVEVYKNSAQLLIKGIFDGYNATVFAYGATGAGKTYTMIGTPDSIGIMERSMDDLFQEYQQLSLTKDIIVRVSYIEIYNEQIKDLLTARDKNLDLREDPSQGVVVNGITEIEVKNTHEILHLLKIGNKHRTIESTGANEVSSRSHAVLQVQLQIKDKASGIQSEIQYSKLSLVDLAGSERAANTQNRGIRLIEGAKINQSLLVLGNCIQALSEAAEKGVKHPFIQYRGSKLTRLLKDSLGGNCRTVMIANVSPFINSFEDTYNTLNYANRAKNIKTQVQRNYLNVDNHISNYTHLIDSLKRENENLKKLLQNRSMNLPSEALDAISNLDQKSQENMKQIELQIAEHFKEELELKRKIFKLDEKLQEAQFEQFKLLTEQRKLKEGSSDSFQHKERLQDNQQLINTLQKSKTDVEKKHQTTYENRQKFNKIIQQEQLTSSDQNYLNSIFKQNILIIENTEIQYKEKKQEAISLHKQLQIQFLKDQLKLRDEIINDQKNIINKNQIVHRISYEPLVELDDIEASVSPQNNDYSFHSVRQGPSNQLNNREYERKKNVQSEKVRIRSHSKNVVSINQSPQRSTEKILHNAVKLPQIGNQNASIHNSNNNNYNSKSRSIQRYITHGDSTEPSLYGAPNFQSNQGHHNQLQSERKKNDKQENSKYENYTYIRNNNEQSSQKVIQKKVLNPSKPFFERSNSKKKINYYDNFKKADLFQRQRSITKNINQSFNDEIIGDQYDQVPKVDQSEAMPQINKYYYKNEKASFQIQTSSNSNQSKIEGNQTEMIGQIYNQGDIFQKYQRQSEDVQNRSFRSTSSSIFSNSSHLNNNNNNLSIQQKNKQMKSNQNTVQNNKILSFLNNDLKIQNISKTEVSRSQISNMNVVYPTNKNQENQNNQEIHSSRRNHIGNSDEPKSHALQRLEEKQESRAERLRQLNINIKYLKKLESEQQQNQQHQDDNQKQLTKQKTIVYSQQKVVAYPNYGKINKQPTTEFIRQQIQSHDQRPEKRVPSKIMSAQRHDNSNQNNKK
ncbi:kinesin motor catalytic domain protein (macronuclear) [Tetrahymena thermophila SB210]|uniref:Kinesin-like protein KIN-8B n=1 Tax=Tetrahymena thermophila (strain SB210) TaxID=312017 RepID=I7M3U8_TETTS|nr:kinesin motor catalytic domain protein [Tetrahymena thermophila SB210]EAS04332.2 kinesin motor catalytic domain protein [Tetrahymena thermophila SB210]|eukprot:XP_001024577.2 kinesin motor catalytic domain protein [Tetrahymena thermophila SB210]